MRIFGTIDEWIKHNPNAILTNAKFMDTKKYSIEFFKKLEKPQKFTHLTFAYNGSYGNGIPFHQTFNGNGYLDNREVNYTCMLVTCAGSGSFIGLTDETAEDPNWTEVDWYG